MEATCNGQAHGRSTAHLADLNRSGLTDETIHAAGIYSEHDCRKLAALFNRKSWSQRMGAALIIPYLDAAGNTVLMRGKPERPAERNGKPVKYITHDWLNRACLLSARYAPSHRKRQTGSNHCRG